MNTDKRTFEEICEDCQDFCNSKFELLQKNGLYASMPMIKRKKCKIINLDKSTVHFKHPDLKCTSMFHFHKGGPWYIETLDNNGNFIDLFKA